MSHLVRNWSHFLSGSELIAAHGTLRVQRAMALPSRAAAAVACPCWRSRERRCSRSSSHAGGTRVLDTLRHGTQSYAQRLRGPTSVSAWDRRLPHRPTGILAAASPNEAPGAGPLEVYPRGRPRRFKSLSATFVPDAPVHRGVVPAHPSPPRFCPTASFHARRCSPPATSARLVSTRHVVVRARKKASIIMSWEERG